MKNFTTFILEVNLSIYVEFRIENIDWLMTNHNHEKYNNISENYSYYITLELLFYNKKMSKSTKKL